MITEQLKNILIGVFVLAAFGVVIWGLLFLHPSFGDGAKTLVVRFTNVDKINVGTRVSFAGRPIGEVSAIYPLAEARRASFQRNGQTYFYELVLHIDSSVQVFESDEISITSTGLLGEKSIAITPKPIPEGVTPLPAEQSKVLYAKSFGSVENAINELGTLTSKAHQLMDQVGGVINSNSQEINLTIANFRQSAAELQSFLSKAQETHLTETVQRAFDQMGNSLEIAQKQLNAMQEHQFGNNLGVLTNNLAEVTSALNRPEKLESIVNNVEKFSDNINKLQQRLDGSWGTLDSSLQDISSAANSTKQFTADTQEMVKDIKLLVQDVKAGKGNVGKIFVGDEFYLRGINILNKVETLVNDVNHYGLLFHLDKKWQRQRTKRMNLMHDLKTAEQFKGYFNTEMDQINTSLSRIAMLLEKIHASEKGDDSVSKKEFIQLLSQAVSQVEVVKDNLNLYKEDFVEKSVN